MNKLTLAQILQYYEKDGTELIQIVLPGDDWEDFHEFYVCSGLVKPFLSYVVLEMRCEKSNRDNSPVLRVLIEKGENHDRLERVGQSCPYSCDPYVCGKCAGVYRNGSRGLYDEKPPADRSEELSGPRLDHLKR